MKILVLGGGDSSERAVSLRSAKAVADAAREAGYQVDEIDPKYELEKLDKTSKDTLVFPILHGKNGEDGTIQRELEQRQLPYLGSTSRVSAVCFDKWQTRQKLEAAGLPMPKGDLVTKETYSLHARAEEPQVLKIVHGGSSIGTLVMPYPDPVVLKNSRVDNLFKLENQAILEEMIEGTEISVSILDHSSLPIIEIIPPSGGFDYENKYNGRTQEICPPKSVSQEVQAEARLLAEKVHKLMGCRHLSRVDFMIDSQNRLFILEINTIPGLTDQSLYPKTAAVFGLSMPQLVTKFVELVRRDYSI